MTVWDFHAIPFCLVILHMDYFMSTDHIDGGVPTDSGNTDTIQGLLNVGADSASNRKRK